MTPPGLWLLPCALMLLVHEMGPYLAAKQRGLDVGLPTFIPFLGARINLKTQNLDAEITAFVGLAGPLVGSTGAFILYLAAVQYHLPRLLAVAYAGFLLNLFNLIPVVPLDGGHIVGAVSAKIWIVDVPMLVALFLWHPSPLLIVIAILALPKVWGASRAPPPVEPAMRLPNAVKLRFAAEYLGLICFLALFAYSIHTQLPGSG